MLCARPIPDSSIPPHHTGICLDLAQIVDLPRRSIPAYAPKLYIDNAAGAQVDGGAGMLFGVNALIEADRRVELALQFGMAVDIVPTERLLDHHQVVGFQAFQVRPILQAIRGIGVYHQTNSAETAGASVRRERCHSQA